MFIFNNESDSYWRFYFVDILIFYHNIWWSAILILFYLYDLNTGKGKNDPDSNTNKFRLKIEVLKLLGGFSKVNKMENILSSLKNHYTIDDSKFKNIKDFNQELLTIEKS